MIRGPGIYCCTLEPQQQVLVSIFGHILLGRSYFLQKLFPVPSGIVSRSRRQVGVMMLGLSIWTAPKQQKSVIGTCWFSWEQWGGDA